jgi:adenylate kinase family enzyme
MERAVVIGCPGSGKSTFARALAEKTGLPLYYLDMMYWNADKTTVERELFLARVSEALEKDRWIIDGNYLSTMEMRLEKCDTVFFLDYPREVCLAGVEGRMGKPRADMPWVETEWDVEFKQYIEDFEVLRRPKILALLEKHTEKQIYIFRTREEAGEFIEVMK